MLKLVKIKQAYTDYLRKYDNRVSYNSDYEYERVYVGVLFKIKNDLLYFAPLTSSGRHKKLILNPIRESITFYPINECKLGGINFNNMIPVINGVYHMIRLDKISSIKLKNLYISQLQEINKNAKYLQTKAHVIYNFKIQHRLFPKYDKATCNFKLLEKMAKKYKLK